MDQVFYRKWRPRKFSEVIGQDSIVQTLRNAVNLNRIAHAYLFTGSKGSGKTSTARIMAKAINCLNPIDGEPDNECQICVDIDSMKYKHNLVKIPTIKIPKISESFSFLINSIITDVLIRNMQELTQDKNAELLYKNAITEPATIGAII